jgi:serine O-acetyltransferase
MGWLNSLQEDIRTAQRRDPAARSALEVALTYPGIHALFTHRIARRLWLAGVPVLPRLIAHLSRLLPGIEIHPGAQIGRGFFIDHGMGVVIGETAVIGDGCHLYQGVTLGGTSTRHEKRHPTLEQNVVVGAGAKIIGAVTVGENSRIGAGAVVVSSVPANATVVGVPGHVVAYTNSSNETVERLPDPEWDRIDALERRLERVERELGGATAEPAAGPSHLASNGGSERGGAGNTGDEPEGPQGGWRSFS